MPFSPEQGKRRDFAPLAWVHNPGRRRDHVSWRGEAVARPGADALTGAAIWRAKARTSTQTAAINLPAVLRARR